jgi:UPF0755 protein
MSNRKRKSDVTSRTKTATARSPAERLEPGRAPSRPRGLEVKEPSRFVSTTVRVFSALFTITLVAMVTSAAIGFVLYNQFERAGPLTEAQTIVVPKGEGRIAIAERLEREGVIGNRWTFIGGHLVQMLFGDRKTQELKAGEYQIKAHASMREVMEILSSGHSILYKVTVPEGLTSRQIVERLKGEVNLTGEITSVPPEGALLPDTYTFSKGASRQEIIDQMEAEMQKTLAALWEQRQPDLPLRTLQEAVTFASIVEKETGRADERARVAAVFHNRLRKGMRLQSDPTIIYGITGGAGSLGRGITKVDIDTKTPYNTYQINGLPPGPIANPGRAALEATLNPAKTDDLFFVADGSGGHTFSSTLKEHNSAVKKWRSIEKTSKAGNADASPNPDVTPIPPNSEPAPDVKASKSSSTKTKRRSKSSKPATTKSGEAEVTESDTASAKKTK